MNPITFILIALVLVVCESAKTCPPGTFVVKPGVCRLCPKGTFQAFSNKKGCRPCPPNKVATKVGSTECTVCPKNSQPANLKHKCVCVDGSVKDNGNCVKCPPGTFFQKGTGYTSCTSCPSGYFQPGSGKFKCLECPKGKVSGDGATKCIKCAKDEGFTKTTNKCEKCKAGYFHEKYSGCEKCPENRYKPKAGLGPCLPCPVGTHSEPGSTKCTRCPKGKVLFKNGKCGSCRAGWYFDDYQVVCMKCGFNEFTPQRNVRTSCYQCSSKTFSLKGATKCIRCPKNKFLLKNGKCKSCPKGSVFQRYDLKCQKCRVNEFTRGNMDYCDSCPNGTYSFPGSTTCFTCGQDKALILAKKKCVKCPAGKFYDTYEAKCKLCYEGSVKKRAGLGDCLSCPGGMTSNAKRTKCVPL